MSVYKETWNNRIVIHWGIEPAHVDQGPFLSFKHRTWFQSFVVVRRFRGVPLFPNGSPFGDPGPHGDLFGDLGPLFAQNWVTFLGFLGPLLVV